MPDLLADVAEVVGQILRERDLLQQRERDLLRGELRELRSLASRLRSRLHLLEQGRDPRPILGEDDVPEEPAHAS